ncbi:hypothetical protein SASPL_137577 [Salvia splendens]|uniref:DM2 domain-containing protein n=1 Tax=Salvia splendens TaxID=180675 RepID=A0A8X8WTK4_SALSN|nr:hypothetical protein SASPL_137577 [Salvia splendens]
MDCLISELLTNEIQEGLWKCLGKSWKHGIGSQTLPQKPPVRPPSFVTSNVASPMRPMDASAAARRKKQKLPEKQLHERVAAILPESALYTQLLEFESQVDASLTRKKIDIQDALKTPTYLQKLCIIGRILEEGMDADQAAIMQKSNPSYPKFSAFFKRVTITLDQKIYPDNHLIIWDSTRAPAPHEGFEVRRKGDQEFTASIRLEMNYMPEKFKLSAALTELLGIEVDTRARIMAAVWHYVKARKLQCPDDPSSFNCDPPLQRVFGEGKVKFTAVTQKITPHLFPPQPIHLEHRIKLSDSQNKDLKLVSGEGSRNAEKERNSDFYNQPWVEDAVIRYLNRKLPGDASGNT